ncbi:transposase [Streptomyces platensis]|nr:transposase [Streptomyces platensis]
MGCRRALAGNPDCRSGVHKQRNTVERCINRLKQWRGPAARCDKLAITYQAALHLAATCPAGPFCPFPEGETALPSEPFSSWNFRALRAIPVDFGPRQKKSFLWFFRINCAFNLTVDCHVPR